MTVMELIKKEEVTDVGKQSQKIIDKGEALFYRTLNTKNNKNIPVEIHSKMFLYKNTHMTLSICRDISDRKEAEDKFKHMPGKAEAVSGIGKSNYI